MIKATIFLFALLSACYAGEITTKEVEYPAGEVTAKGFLALPEGDGPYPGVIVVHEWWGVNDYPRERAKKIAKLGYAALAIDMYGDGKTTEHPKDAGAFSSEAKRNQDEMIARFQAGLDFLKSQTATDKEHLAAIGYCFGGNVALQMAYNGLEDLDGVASFHGSLNLQKPTNPKPVKAKALVCNGAADPFITPESISLFKKTMEDAGIEFEFHNYKGALHGFTNKAADDYGKANKLPLAYHPEADQKSWDELKSFLSTLFSKSE